MLLSVLSSATGWAQPVGQVLQDEFPQVEFEPEVDPSEEDVVKEVQALGDLDEIRNLLMALVLDLEVEIDRERNTVLLEGTRAQVEAAAELLDQPTCPLREAVLECQLVRMTEARRRDLQVDGGQLIWSAHSGADPVLLRLGRFETRRFSDLGRQASSFLDYQTPALTSGCSGTIQIWDKFPRTPYKPQVGLKLEARPVVKYDGSIVCELNGEFTIPIQLLGNRYPRMRTLTFDVQARIRNGETLMVDGLLTPELWRRAAEAVPQLAELPMTGPLFAAPGREQSICLMLTPREVK